MKRTVFDSEFSFKVHNQQLLTYGVLMKLLTLALLIYSSFSLASSNCNLDDFQGKYITETILNCNDNLYTELSMIYIYKDGDNTIMKTTLTDVNQQITLNIDLAKLNCEISNIDSYTMSTISLPNFFSFSKSNLGEYFAQTSSCFFKLKKL